jgi:O-antigen ligase
MAAGILVAGILFTKSIAALVALAFMLLFAVIFHVATLRRLALVLALGGAFWVAPQVSTVTHSPVVNVFDKVSGIVVGASSADPKIRDAGRYESTVGVRMEGYREAFGMWKEHPVFGAGLGVHLHRQSLEGKPEKYILQIHNTALWLLAETGLAGFFVMAGIFVALLHKVWSISRTPPGRPDTGFWFETGVLLILVGWAVMSLFHEIMYQRIVWLLVGMALRSPVKGLSFWKKIPATYR